MTNTLAVSLTWICLNNLDNKNPTLKPMSIPKRMLTGNKIMAPTLNCCVSVKDIPSVNSKIT